MLLLEVVTMIRIIRTPETLQRLLDYCEENRSMVLNLFSTVSTWGHITYPVAVGDEDSEYVGELVEKASMVLEAIARHEEIYSGVAHYCGTYMVIVEHATDALRLLSIASTHGKVSIPLTFNPDAQISIQTTFKEEGTERATEYATRIAVDAIEFMLWERKPDNDIAYAQAQYWMYLEDELKDIIERGDCTYVIKCHLPYTAILEFSQKPKST